MATDIPSSDFTLIVDAGGFSRGSDPLSLIYNKYLARGMSWLNFAAVNLGYREWGTKPSFLKNLADSSKLEFLCANVFDKATGKPFFAPYIHKELHAANPQAKIPFKKLNVAIVGLTDQEFSQLFVNRPNEPELLYRPPLEVAKELMPAIVGKNEVVILLYYGKFAKMQEILDQVPGFDVAVLGGESYNLSSKTEADSKVIRVSTPSMGKYVGVLSLTLDKKKNIISSSARQVPLKEGMEEESRFLDLVKAFEVESQNPRP